MDEPIRQDRRYKGIRPRRAMRGAYQVASTTNNGTWMLYNNSSGAYALLVHSASCNANGNAILGVQRGTNGTHLGTETAFITGDAVGPGQVFFADQVALITPDYVVALPQSYNDVPLAVLMPGWGLFVQDNHGPAVVPIIGAYLWEWLEPDQLDWIY